MMKKMRNLMRSEEGQGMTEYIIIVALIAIAAIGIITIFGQNIRALFGASATALGGQEASTVDGAGGKTGQIGVQRKSLQNFGQNSGNTN